MEDKVIGEVIETTDYSLFILHEENREIRENQNLIEEIRKNGVLVPIIVNEKNEVIDGQHRLHIAKKLKVPVPYFKKDNIGKKEIISINSTAKQWTMHDYVGSFIASGDDNYRKFQELFETYRINIAALASLAFNTTDSAPGELVKAGKLKFVNYEFLVSFLDFHEEFQKKMKFNASSNFTKSVYTLYRLKNFDPIRFMKKSGDIMNAIQGISKQGVITETIVSVYNKGLTKDDKVIRFTKNAKGNIEFVGEVKDEINKMNLKNNNNEPKGETNS